MARLSLERKLELLDEQIELANGGQPASFPRWQAETEVVLRRVMGEGHIFVYKFRTIKYRAQVTPASRPASEYFMRGMVQAVTILHSCKKELELEAEEAAGEEAEAEALVTAEGPSGDQPEETSRTTPGNIFVVHGHDDATRLDATRVLSALTDQTPVILHEKANGGRTLLEKFEQHAHASDYAVVLLTGDDVGRPAVEDEDENKLRGRQNVVFELGFFIGKLGRASVAILYSPGVELPSDLNGLVYIPLDEGGAWRMQLARELQDAGFTIEWQALGGF